MPDRGVPLEALRGQLLLQEVEAGVADRICGRLLVGPGGGAGGGTASGRGRLGGVERGRQLGNAMGLPEDASSAHELATLGCPRTLSVLRSERCTQRQDNDRVGPNAFPMGAPMGAGADG